MKTLKLFTAFICFVALVSCGTESTPLPQGDIEDGWIRFGVDSGMVFSMYSKVKMDSNAYTADIATIHNDEMYVDSQRIGFVKSLWVIDAETDEILEYGYVFCDSLGNVVCENADSAYARNRESVTYGKISVTGIKLARLLYDNEHNLQRFAEPIKVDWGKKEWYKYEESDGVERYLMVSDKTDSGYTIWYYARVNNFGLKFATRKDDSGTERIVYGVVKKMEINVDERKERILEVYAVDKYNDIFFNASDEMDHEWKESSEALIQGVKDYVEKNNIR